MPRKIRTLVLALVVILVVAILSLIVFMARALPARPPLPNPNGYDDFVKASEAVLGNLDDFQTLKRDSLEALVSTNAEALRLLVTELALRSAQSEQGHPPARLDDLVTNYLSKVPQDPFSGQPLVYRVQGTEWLLYSVGPDGVDDGGKAAGRGWPVKGDILFDSPW